MRTRRIIADPGAGFRVVVLGTAAATAALALAVLLSGPVGGHLDPPAPPVIEVQVEVTGVATDQDEDDGIDGDAELAIHFIVTHAGHPPPVQGTDLRISDDYAWDTFGGLIQPVVPPVELYWHEECTPMNAITVDLKLEEEDPLSDDSLGIGTAVFPGPGVQVVQTNGGGRTGKVRIEVSVAQVPGDPRCNDGDGDGMSLPTIDIHTPIGDTLKAPIRINTIHNASSWKAGFRFNPHILECISFTEGPYLSDVGTTTWTPGTIDNVNGIVTSHTSTLEPGKSQSGTGILAYITFRVKNYGETVIDLTDEDGDPCECMVLDPDGSEISLAFVDGEVIVREPGVGGIVELPVDGADAPARAAEGAGSSAPPYAALAGAAAAAAVAIAAGGWYARRRLS